MKQWQAAWGKSRMEQKPASRICPLRLAMGPPCFNSGTLPCVTKQLFTAPAREWFILVFTMKKSIRREGDVGYETGPGGREGEGGKKHSTRTVRVPRQTEQRVCVKSLERQPSPTPAAWEYQHFHTDTPRLTWWSSGIMGVPCPGAVWNSLAPPPNWNRSSESGLIRPTPQKSR